MRVVVWTNKETEAKALTDEQVSLLRRAVIAFIEQRSEALVEATTAIDSGEGQSMHFRTILEIDDDITTLESLRATLFQVEPLEGHTKEV